MLAFPLSTGDSQIRICPQAGGESAPWLFAEVERAGWCKDSELGPWAARQG